jgi:hypothetical protein
MIASRKLVALAALSTLTVVALLGGAPDPLPGGTAGADRLTRPTMVVLDFRDRPISEIVDTIARRSGKRLSPHGTPTKDFTQPDDSNWTNRPVTLVAQEPVPFWEAIDRLAEAGRVGRRLIHFGDTGSETTGVVFEESSDDLGLAHYTGPFRVGLASVHEHREVLFVRAPWVRIYPSGFPAAADATTLRSAPADGGPLYAELLVMAEPGLICRRNGALTGLEAVDERGRTLIAALDEPAVFSWSLNEVFSGGISPVLRIPLRRPDAQSKVIQRLSGSIPVELATLKSEPAIVIPLAGAEGKEVKGGGVVVSVETARFEAGGEMKLVIKVKPEGEMDPGLRNARIISLMTHQFRICDAAGAPVRSSRGVMGGDGNGAMSLSFEYGANPDSRALPAEFRYYDLDRTEWAIPFEFHNIPLP